MKEKEALNNMEEQIRTLYNNIISYNAQFIYLSSLLEHTKTNYQLTLESFALGKSNILELLDTRDRYEQSFMDYYNARYKIVNDYNELKYIIWNRLMKNIYNNQGIYHSYFYIPYIL